MALGTDGFGKSDGRKALRDHFEVDANHIAYVAMHTLYEEKKIKKEELKKAAKKLNIDSNKKNPTDF